MAAPRDPRSLVVTRTDRGWRLDLGGVIFETPVAAAPGVAVEELDGAQVVRFEGTVIGIGRPATLAAIPDLDLALVPEGAAVGGLSARWVVPGSASGVGGPRGVAAAVGDVVTFTGRGDELYVYSREERTRWSWLRRFGRGRAS